MIVPVCIGNRATWGVFFNFPVHDYVQVSDQMNHVYVLAVTGKKAALTFQWVTVQCLSVP